MNLAALAERLWAKVQIRGADECWPFCGSIRPNGYGQVFTTTGGSPLKSHRAAFLVTHGYLTPGLDVAHTCDERYAKDSILYRRCCNPSHLREMPRRENLLHSRTLGRTDPVLLHEMSMLARELYR